jgi:tetratricopeptide (TPR) repeat protein
MKLRNASRLTTALFIMAMGARAFGLDYLAEPKATAVLDTEAKLAQGFLMEASARFKAGKYDEAEQWVRRGLELDPESSDLLLLRSRLTGLLGLPLDQALAQARAALAGNRWTQGRPLDAFLRLVDLLIETHSWKTALIEFNNRIPERDILRDPRLAARLASILYHAGEPARADRLAAEAWAAWPDDPGILAVRLEFRLPDPAAKRWFDRYRDATPEYRRALFWYINGLPSGPERLQRSADYLALGGTDAFVLVWGLESALAAEGADRARLEAAWVERFCARPGPVDLDAAGRLLGLLAEGAARQKLWAWLGTGAVDAYRDFDHDGRFEENARFQEGVLQRWTVDMNQDNLADLQIDWRDGRPASALQRSTGRQVLAWYDAYPEIGRVEIGEGGRNWAISLPRGRVELACLEIPFEGPSHPLQTLPWLEIGGRNITMDPAAWKREASEQTIYRAGLSGMPAEQIKLERGLPVASRDDSDGDGVFDHLVWYEQGRPVMGFRDVENNGSFDVLETYRDGRISELVHVDPRLVQTYRYAPPSGRSEWDLDRDGRVDTVEMRNANGRLIQWFSSLLDGNFNIRAEDGIIRAVSLKPF